MPLRNDEVLWGGNTGASQNKAPETCQNNSEQLFLAYQWWIKAQRNLPVFCFMSFFYFVIKNCIVDMRRQGFVLRSPLSLWIVFFFSGSMTSGKCFSTLLLKKNHFIQALFICQRWLKRAILKKKAAKKRWSLHLTFYAKIRSESRREVV